jgi:putative PIN family toxin of toxin-antitoxin system
MNKPRFVLDTNVLISAMLMDGSLPARALSKAETQGDVLYSYATLTELSQVLLRPKFSRYVTAQNVEGMLARIHRAWQHVTITHRIQACRDPRDDMFLELGINGNADVLITGDNDLLAIAPYRTLGIVTPASFIG